MQSEVMVVFDSYLWLTDWLTDWLPDWLTDWFLSLTDWMTACLTDWLIRITDWFFVLVIPNCKTIEIPLIISTFRHSPSKGNPNISYYFVPLLQLIPSCLQRRCRWILLGTAEKLHILKSNTSRKHFHLTSNTHYIFIEWQAQWQSPSNWADNYKGFMKSVWTPHEECWIRTAFSTIIGHPIFK